MWDLRGSKLYRCVFVMFSQKKKKKKKKKKQSQDKFDIDALHEKASTQHKVEVSGMHRITILVPRKSIFQIVQR